jgi:hypothetical protein
MMVSKECNGRTKNRGACPYTTTDQSGFCKRHRPVEVECKASQYRLHAAALEVLRQTPGFLTYPEAVSLAKAGKRTGW